LQEAMGINRAYRPVSLDSWLYYTDGAVKGPLGECLGETDPGISGVEERHALKWAIGCLSPRLQEIIRLRFFAELPQTEVARRLGLSQMHISRLERQALLHLRQMMTEWR
jgi:RNA polymerase sigma-B factor